MAKNSPRYQKIPTEPPPRRNQIAIYSLLFYNLLRSPEYAPYLVIRSGTPYIDMAKLPRGVHIPLCGDDIDGFILRAIINQAIPFLDGQFLEVRLLNECRRDPES